jgi:metal-responsive CopG/Arc/MetJ family transcriptional regulator
MPRTFTISFPDELAAQVEQLAKQESRNTSELFREAFRTYRIQQIRKSMNQFAARAGRNNPREHVEDEVQAMVDEVRASRPAKRPAKRAPR